MPKTKTVPTFSLAAIERRFTFASWIGQTWHPAVDNDELTGGYQIRVLVAETRSGANTSTKYDYFYTTTEGIITAAPRGYARDYKPGRFDPAALDEAVAKYAKPEQGVES